MKAIPTIDFEIVDRSYVESRTYGDRKVFIPIISEKGPETIELIDSYERLEQYYGRPDTKYGYALYIAQRALLHTSYVYVLRVLPDDATLSNKRVSIDISDYTTTPIVQNDYTNTDTIELDDVSLISVGDKIYFGDNGDNVYVVNSVDTANNTITLNEHVTVAKNTEVHKCPEIVLDSVVNAKKDTDIKGDTGYTNSLFTFYPIGRGKAYNRYKIKFVRNKTLEKMFIDENGNVLYPYLFVDIYVLEDKLEGGTRIVEGPITVSLVNKIGETVIRDPSSGQDLFIGTRVNKDFKFIKILVNEEKLNTILIGSGYNDTRAYIARKLLIDSFKNSVNLEKGSDGSLFDATGNVNWSVMTSKLVSVFEGTYSSECEKLRDSNLQYYPIDYVVDAGFPIPVKSAIVEFCDHRQDVLGLISLPKNSDYTQDVSSRKIELPFDSPNVMIYSEWRKIYDPFTGKDIWVPPTYHMIEHHLETDNTKGIAEPVAESKAMIKDKIELAYYPTITQANILAENQINPTIATPQGIIVPTQYTAYKRFSVLQRAHVVKVIHKIRKDLQLILRDLLQLKATPTIIKEAYRRVNNYMSSWLVGGPIASREALNSYSAQVEFNQKNSVLYVMLKITPVRAIESIYITLEIM